jgi:enoyl-[acyl-carrier protein] reductase I
MVAGLLSGKRALVMGVANNHSIAWGVARALSQAGAEIAFTYQGEALGKRVRPLAESLGSDISLDILIHAIGFSNKNELKGRYADTSRENFSRTMVISAFSFTEAVKRAAELMPDGGSAITLTYGGATRVMPNYNVMGVAKAALEASVRYLAADYGPRGVRVNAISAGPVRTLAGAGIADARLMYDFQRRHAPLRRTVTIDEIGGSALYLASPLSGGVTGEIHFVDSGYNIISMPDPRSLQVIDAVESQAEE